VQLDFYGSITAKANTIDPVVVSPDDRYFLRVHLTPLLTLSNKLNELISPWVETEVKRIHNELKKMDSIEGLKLANLVKYITTTMIKDNY
jgi:hypothetical protein